VFQALGWRLALKIRGLASAHNSPDLLVRVLVILKNDSLVRMTRRNAFLIKFFVKDSSQPMFVDITGGQVETLLCRWVNGTPSRVPRSQDLLALTGDTLKTFGTNGKESRLHLQL
jgi:hypothetical protein